MQNHTHGNTFKGSAWFPAMSGMRDKIVEKSEFSENSQVYVNFIKLIE